MKFILIVLLILLYLWFSLVLSNIVEIAISAVVVDVNTLVEKNLYGFIAL